MNRVAGLETEYGCLVDDPRGPGEVIRKVRDWAFQHRRYGLVDVHQRDWDEPAGNGGFLFNGGRLYIDMGHVEYCTPECLSLGDVLRFDQAGDRLLNQALDELGLSSNDGFIRNNIDHYSGATFGCHENYSVARTAPLTEKNVLSLLAFLTLRVLYTGAGRVGASDGAMHRGDLRNAGADPCFQISQRADYIQNDLFEWVQFNRAIINTRDEPLGDETRFRRLHLLHGDTSVLPITLLLKVGTTSLVLDLFESNSLPGYRLEDAVLCLRGLSHQVEPPWRVVLEGGRTWDAIEILTAYREAAWREFHGRDKETDAVLGLWKAVLEGLDQETESLIGQVDWVTKRWLLGRFVAQEGISWRSPWLKSQDLEYHHIRPDRSLALGLAHVPVAFQSAKRDIEHACRHPPKNTRAAVRSVVMKALEGRAKRYFVDWDMIYVEGAESLNLMDPFERPYGEAQEWIAKLDRVSATDPGREGLS